MKFKKITLTLNPMKNYTLPLIGLALGATCAVVFKNDVVDTKTKQDIHMGQFGKFLMVVSGLVIGYKLLKKN